MNWADRAKRVVDTTFRTFGEPATYTPAGGGAPVAVTVIRKTPQVGVDAVGARFVAGGDSIDVRRAEVPDLRQGDGLQTADVAYTVTGAPTLDADRLVWTVPVAEA